MMKGARSGQSVNSQASKQDAEFWRRPSRQSRGWAAKSKEQRESAASEWQWMRMLNPRVRPPPSFRMADLAGTSRKEKACVPGVGGAVESSSR